MLETAIARVAFGQAHYGVEALFRCEGVASPGTSVRAIISQPGTGSQDEMVFYDHLDYVGEREGWHAVGQTIDVDETTPQLTLNLFYSWEVSGKVLWGDPRLYDITELGTSRPVGLKGADVIIFSNMGDGREGGSLWEPFIRMRALDNQVHIVAAVNGGRSCVVSP
jgi:predicted amidohydrolase